LFEYIEKSWHSKLSNELKKEYIKNLDSFIKNERKTKTIYPKEQNVFKSLNFTKLNQIKVVILGQDPYCL